MPDWNPSKHKTVYVLGAGTSASSGAPLIGNFMDASKRTFEKKSVDWGEEPLGSQNKYVFREALESWTQHFGTYNIEEFYVLADLHERLRLVKLLKTYKLSSPADAVRYLISKTLDESMGSGPSHLHRAFVEHTWHHAAEKPRHGSVITLNWDIALDNAVDHFFGVPSVDPGYDNFKPWGERANQEASRPYRVLKLHGSMNWWFCKQCKTLWYDVQQKGVLGFWEGAARRTCPGAECWGSHLTPGMIPPMSQKMEQNEIFYFMHSLWLTAREELATCDWLVIAGYSFPPTDVQFRLFVAEALASNRNLQGVTVLTNRKVGNARSDFEDSYAQLVGALPNHVVVNFRYEGFERWVDRTCSAR